MKNFIALIVFVLAACASTFAQAPFGLDKVKEIKLLESNRDDVRRILAGYKLETSDNLPYNEWFHNDDVTISVWYSEGKCAERFQSWNVSEYKVIGIDVTPKLLVKVENIGFDFSNYKKEKVYTDSDQPEIYHNKELGIAVRFDQDEVDSISFIPTEKYYSLSCNKKKSKKFYASKSWFGSDEKQRPRIYTANYPGDVTSLVLSSSEVIANCALFASTEDKKCSADNSLVTVFTIAKDPTNDVLTYSYRVSGGKIIGRGENVMWDLSGVKPGIYKIKAEVDDGCGFCGKALTKTVVVKECADCGKK